MTGSRPREPWFPRNTEHTECCFWGSAADPYRTHSRFSHIQVHRPIDRLYESIERNPDRLALAGEPHGSMTYAELGSAVDALAAALQEIDGEPGSRVGICARNTTEHLL